MSKTVKKHLSMLGKKARDKVTGFEGVVSSVSFDLYGCVSAAITPPIDDKGETRPGNWFDVTRVEFLDNKPVMNVPDFKKGYVAEGKKGAAEKPAPQS